MPRIGGSAGKGRTFPAVEERCSRTADVGALAGEGRPVLGAAPEPAADAEHPWGSPSSDELACQGRAGGRVRLWCLRHAEAHTGARIAGAVPPESLTPRGRRQAVAAARALAGGPITRIYASTTPRARQTADLLATSLGVDVVALPELVEVGVGEHVLRAWVVERDLGRRAANGESGREVVARVTAAFRRIAGAHPGETVAVVGHVASLTVALGRLCGLDAAVWGTPLPHARPFLVEWDGRAWRCPAWPGVADAPRATPA